MIRLMDRLLNRRHAGVLKIKLEENHVELAIMKSIEIFV